MTYYQFAIRQNKKVIVLMHFVKVCGGPKQENYGHPGQFFMLFATYHFTMIIDIKLFNDMPIIY